MRLAHRKRLLICIDWFFPGFRGGGPLDSCKNLADAMAEDLDIYVITRNTDLGSTTPYPDIEPNTWIAMPRGYQVMYLDGGHLSLSWMRKVITDIQPDHIYVNSMFSRKFSLNPLLLNAMGLIPAGTVLTVAPRGMLLPSALGKKKWKKKLYLGLVGGLFRKKNVNFHATNEQEAKSIIKWFSHQQILMADNLPSRQLPAVKALQKQAGQLSISYIARIDPIKNLRLFLKILSAVPTGEIHLTVGGPVEDQSYWRECEQMIAALPPNIRVEYKGPIEKTAVSTIIAGSHLYALLTKGENFGHSIFQALQAGRPVLISDQTPWRELETKGIGFDAPLNDEKEIMRYLCSALAWDQAEFDHKVDACRTFVGKYLASDRNLDLYKAYFA
jgi:glycosyltransferase involved in cell wall biosynthesis